MNTITGTGMAAAGAAAPAGSTCEGLWSIFATDVGSFEETARALSGSGGIFLVYGRKPAVLVARHASISPPARWRQRDVAQIVSIYELLTIRRSRFPELSVESGVYYGSVG
jgi:hypothetical protein